MKLLKHSFPVAAHFDWALAVTLSAPASDLAPLAMPGLELDTLRDQGFLAVACVQTRRLRPAFMPTQVGVDFFLVGYRLFVRFSSPSGKSYRGLQILGSETDRWLMVLGGRWLTYYKYRHTATQVIREEGQLHVSTSSGLDIMVRLGASNLPPESIFKDWKEARYYAGPLPYTFGSEDQGRTIVRVEGVRTHWNPRPVMPVSVRAPFLNGLLPSHPIPASAFLVEDIDYRWKRGVRERLT